MISPIRVGAGASQDEVATAYNDLANQIESENRTQVIKDETGNNRIILGRFPDGTYGFAISQEGVDVLEAVEE